MLAEASGRELRTWTRSGALETLADIFEGSSYGVLRHLTVGLLVAGAAVLKHSGPSTTAASIAIAFRGARADVVPHFLLDSRVVQPVAKVPSATPSPVFLQDSLGTGLTQHERRLQSYVNE